MTLSKQQLIGKLARKILSLDENVKFLDFALDVENLQKSETLPQQIMIKKRKTFAVSMNYFMKNLRNEIALASTEKLIRSYTSITRDFMLLTCIQMD